MEQIVTTEAVLSTDFGLNKQYSHKPTMYFTSDASSTTKTVPDVTYDLLKNISSTLPSAIEDNETVPKGPFQMPLAADLIWTFMFGTTIGCAILGNLVVIWIVLGIIIWYQQCTLVFNFYDIIQIISLICESTKINIIPFHF